MLVFRKVQVLMRAAFLLLTRLFFCKLLVPSYSFHLVKLSGVSSVFSLMHPFFDRKTLKI